MIIDLLKLPRSCVYGVFDESRNRFHFRYTQNVARSLGEVYDKFVGDPGYHLRVMSETSDPVHQRLFCEYYRARFLDMGWVEVGPPRRSALSYRPRVLVASDFKTVHVELVTARGDGGMVVGVFKDRTAAQDFVQVHYGDDNRLCFPVYAANSLTKEFLQKEHKKMLDIKI